MEEAEAVEDMEEADIPEDISAASPEAITDTVAAEVMANTHHPAMSGALAEDIPAQEVIDNNIHRPAASGPIAETDIEAGIMDAMSGDIIMEDIAIPEDIMEGITGTIIEVMPRMEQPSAFFWAG